MKKIILIGLLVSGCSGAHIEWTAVGQPALNMDAAKTDCEFKARQVAHTFGSDFNALEGFARRCMGGHGYSGMWVKN